MNWTFIKQLLGSCKTKLFMNGTFIKQLLRPNGSKISTTGTFIEQLLRPSGTKLSACGRTDTGKKRARNEDNFCIMPKRNLFIVADGMGGHNAGDVASKTAVDTLADYLISKRINKIVNNHAEVNHTLLAGFRHTNNTIMAMSKGNNKLKGMGCTMIACLVDDNHIHFCHVGDVRAYIDNGKSLKQITADHTVAAEYAKTFNDKKEQIKPPPPRNIVSRAIGFPFPKDPDYSCLTLEPGSRLLLCSDGLWTMLNDRMIHKILVSYPAPDKVCDIFIEKANLAGGKDNITAVAIFFE